MGNTSLALETLSTSNPARPLLHDALKASERASHLTRQLLAYAGKGHFVIEPIDISGLVREISALIQTSIPKNVHLRLDLAEGLSFIQADASQIQQLVMNLVINGAEAIGPDKSGSVSVTTSVQEVDEAYLQTALGDPTDGALGSYVSLEVQDTGIGMDRETLNRIFDPFFTTKFTGRGLGLAAAQGIVRSHKGIMRVYSQPGRGTTFKVLFPASGETVAARPPAATPVVARSELVLVIDDEDVIRRTAKSMLERYGYTVVLAEDGKEGVELFKVLAEKVAVVLLDMTMPVMNGEETFRRLKAVKPDIRVILSSGYNEVEAIHRFAGKGLNGFLQKPYSAAALIQKIASVMAQPGA
jgi:CheY-like chemotaxis protein